MTRDRDGAGRFATGHVSFKKRNPKNNKFTRTSIIVSSRKFGRIVAKVDEEDILMLSKYTWVADVRKNQVYLRTGVLKKIYLHRLVMAAKRGDLIDHVNCDSLDCRKMNLRRTSKSVNALNVKVTAHKRKNKWGARVKRDGRYVHLGVYVTYDEAVAAKRKYLERAQVIRRKNGNSTNSNN